MNTPKVFQLSVLSQNDPGTVDGANLAVDVFFAPRTTLRAGSSPMRELVSLPIPAPNPPPTPTWFFEPQGPTTIRELLICLVIVDHTHRPQPYPPIVIRVPVQDVMAWARIPYQDRPNIIYREGVYGVFGFAQEGPDGPIYTITAGVLNPRVHGT